MLALVSSGHGHRSLKSGQVTQEASVKAGMMEVFAAGTVIDFAQWDGVAGEVIAVELPEATVSRLMQDEAPALNIGTRYELYDANLADLTQRLAHEVAMGSPNGPLYGQGLTLALLGWLKARYGAPTARRPRAKTFGSRDIQRLRSLVVDHPSADLRIERLADAVAMSPHHFARMFKATFGQTPHAYVLERRIEAACQALRCEPERPIADVAGACGFANQSHFTEAFRRRTGLTPARWRQDR